MKTAFEVISGTELYYYSTVYEIKLDFTKADETKNLEFYNYMEPLFLLTYKHLQ